MRELTQPLRPTSLLVLAIFHFIIGGFGLLCGVCGAASLANGGRSFVPTPGAQTPQQTAMQDFQDRVKNRTEKEITWHSSFAAFNLTTTPFLSPLFILSGLT